jgi:hypothetical protein
VRLDGARLDAGVEKGGVGARRVVVGACRAGRGGGAKGLDRAESVLGVRGRGFATGKSREVARFRLGGERGDDRAALLVAPAGR